MDAIKGAIKLSIVQKLENDPGEMRNIANNQRYKKTLDEHRQFLKEWIQISKDTAGSKYLRLTSQVQTNT